MAFRDSILAISPVWVRLARVAGAIQYAIGTGMDAVADWCIEGVNARYPGFGTTDALGYIGTDKDLERGPAEPAASYAARLQSAWDTHLTHGSGFTLLEALRWFFLPAVAPPIRLVSNAGWWHTWDGVSATVKVLGDVPWAWDEFVSVPRFWRGWVVIDGTDLCTADLWTDTDLDLWGDGGTWGSDLAAETADAFRRIVRKWKPRHVRVKNLLVTFEHEIFRPTDVGNADTMEEPATQLMYDSMFFGEVGN